MPNFKANNNQAGKLRAPSHAMFLEKLEKVKESAKVSVRMLHINSLAADESVPQHGNCAYMHPDSFPPDAVGIDQVYMFPRTHAQFVVLVRRNSNVPLGCIVLAEVHFTNLELCDGVVESWSIYSAAESTPDALSVTFEIRPLKQDKTCIHSQNSKCMKIQAESMAKQVVKHCFQRIVTESERVVLVFKEYPDVPFFLRVMEIEAEDENEDEFTMPDIYRAKVDENTCIFWSDMTDATDDSFTILNPPSKEKSAVRVDTIEIYTNDEEMFPVKKKLLYPCIKLTSAVMAGRGVHKEASSSIQVDVDCCTFDRVLLYLEHEARAQQADFGFDPMHTESLLTAAQTLGCMGLIDLCKKRLGEFETRVRKEAIHWQEILAHNASGSIYLLMQGMVFDVTRWLPEHPGGSVIIPREALNVDSTVFFEIYHASRQSFLYLKQFYVGELAKEDYSKVPKGTAEPSKGFLEEFKAYTSWRIQPEEKVFKSF